jgi:hypothetical protein
LSLFPYNLTMAQEHFPLTKKEALSKGYQWRDPDKRDYQPQSTELPDHIDMIEDSIVKEILACETCKKNYRIIPQELKFYRENVLPLPRKCFNCRHENRFLMRNPRHLWQRSCQKCSTEILSSYAPVRPEIVYCEDCYQNALI